MSDQSNHNFKRRPGSGFPSRAELDLLIEKVRSQAEANPEKTATLLSLWLKRPAQKSTDAPSKASHSEVSQQPLRKKKAV